MNGITKEYIEFFSIYEQLEGVLDDFFSVLFTSLSKEECEYFTRLRASCDINQLIERIGEGLETTFTHAELSDIMNLHRTNPVLVKLLRTRESLYTLQKKAAQDMIDEAMRKMPYLISHGLA